MASRPRTGWILLAFAIVSLSLASPAITWAGTARADEGGTIAATPTYVDFGSVLRDEPVVRTFQVQNGRDAPATITLERSGTLGAWVTPEAATLTVGPRETRVVNLTVEVPGDAPNGAYAGNVTAIMESSDPDTSEVDVRVGVLIRLSAAVTGEEIVDVSAGGLTVPDVETASRVPVSLIASNGGNVRVTPRVHAIVRSPVTGDVVHEASWTAPTVRAGARENLTHLVDADLLEGQYRVSLIVSVRDAIIAEETTTFDVLEEGALRRDGRMGAIHTTGLVSGEKDHRLEAGQSFHVVAPFSNTGDVDVDAHFEGYIARDGRVVKDLASDTLRVAPGEDVDLRVLVTDVTEPGRYDIQGHVRYEDRVTEENAWILNLEPAPDAGPGRGIPAPGVLAAVGALVALARMRARA